MVPPTKELCIEFFHVGHQDILNKKVLLLQIASMLYCQNYKKVDFKQLVLMKILIYLLKFN